MKRSSRARLTEHHLPQFPGDSLFDRLARVVCGAACLPRKELFEAWEVGKRIRRRMRGGRIIDVAGGHGLLAWVLLLLDDSSPGAVVVDPRKPASFERLEAAIVARWPRLEGRVTYAERKLGDEDLGAGDLLCGVHACGPLTDRVLDIAIAARCRVAALPCCHSVDRCDLGDLGGWLPVPLAVDATRVARLRGAGFDVHTMTIPEDITPENRLLLGVPEGSRPE